jgi:hypothetical protein
MNFLVRAAGAALCLGLAAGVTPAASQKEIDEAIKKGCDYLRSVHGNKNRVEQFTTHGAGPTCLAGLAMLEGQVPAGDPAVVNVTAAIRDAAYSASKTYQVALCLMYLDRYGDTADDPLIQILACRLLAGQTPNGGWGYDCPSGGFNDQQLRAIKAEKNNGAPRMHPEVVKYAQTLQGGGLGSSGDDNSNTQFAALAVWMARKHGVPVEDALNRIQTRFMTSQSPTGSWHYNGGVVGGAAMGPGSSPSMFCAGLIGLATAVGRREEARAKANTPKVEEPKPDSKPERRPGGDDPLFNPPEKPVAPPKKPARPAPDALDIAVGRAFDGLGMVVAGSAQQGGGALVLSEGGMHGSNDLYFFWSLERVCVIYGIERLGGVNWYEAGAHTLVVNQAANGTWGGTKTTGYGVDVNTSFAVLFLCRSNLARDLSGKVQNDTYTTMTNQPNRGGGASRTGDPRPGGNTATIPEPASPGLPEVVGSDAAVEAAKLVRSEGKDFKTQLQKLRDTRGDTWTEALVTATNRLEADRLKEARQALAERLTRMSAATLRWMAKADEPELRRGAVLAMGMKDDKAHVPDLIDALLDDEEVVVRAAKAGLKSITGQDFGPVNNATIGEKKIAVEGWREWYGKQKK